MSNKLKDFKEIGLKEKIGNVTIHVTKTSYRLRWFYNNKDYSFSIKNCLGNQSWAIVELKAQEITMDMLLGTFDESLNKYKPKKESMPKLSVSTLTLDILWEKYKEAKLEVVSETTKYGNWLVIDKALKRLSKDQLALDKLYEIGVHLRKFYSDGTLRIMSEFFSACLNWSKKAGFIPEVPYLGIEFNVSKKNLSKEIFTTEEVKTIINAFKNRYQHYAYFVEMCFLSARRYEDIIALTFGDITETHIKFDKAKSNTARTVHDTKNGKTTLFPINNQIYECLTNQKQYLQSIGHGTEKDNLVFPAPKGKYIRGCNFLRRYWQPLVLELVEKGEVKKYLPLYNLRHSRATHLIQSGIDLQTIAYLMETSIEMLSRHYLGVNSTVELPNL